VFQQNSKELDGCPRFANLPRLAVGAYLGRKRRAKPHQSFCPTGNKYWVPPCPDFLWRLVVLIHSMRLSLMKGAHADLSSAAWQEIGVKPSFGLSGITALDVALRLCHN
jgi:hypothetical protein